MKPMDSICSFIPGGARKARSPTHIAVQPFRVLAVLWLCGCADTSPLVDADTYETGAADAAPPLQTARGALAICGCAAAICTGSPKPGGISGVGCAVCATGAPLMPAGSRNGEPGGVERAAVCANPAAEAREAPGRVAGPATGLRTAAPTNGALIARRIGDFIGHIIGDASSSEMEAHRRLAGAKLGRPLNPSLGRSAGEGPGLVSAPGAGPKTSGVCKNDDLGEEKEPWRDRAPLHGSSSS
mmetsp:Transcript_52765/g.92616  ORF Transcript_52765/g.92616 Transcript_52765/m.92616 type:complete len:242 (-) Transcript_52765:717-1442(-)